jgi:serine/threonine protein kinase
MSRAGDTIGPYLLISKLGRGSFGVVWLAERRTSLATTNVALKMPLDDDIDMDAIRQEANVWVQASGHPNVLPIIEANIYEGQVIIASEYAPDGSLDARLKSGGASPVPAAIELTAGILAGLQHLHSRNIIHRDLKPANILLQGDMPRLTDFGISRMLKTTSQSLTVAGSPAYMAPEAFDGKRNVQTDVWSAGVILYHLLTGHLPFPQADITSLVGAILARNPDPLPLSIPKPIKEVVACALNKDRRLRYKSASEMLQALRRTNDPTRHYDAPEPITILRAKPAKPTPAPERPRAAQRSAIAKFIIAAAVIVAAILAGIGGFYFTRNLASGTPNSPMNTNTRGSITPSSPVNTNSHVSNPPSGVVNTNSRAFVDPNLVPEVTVALQDWAASIRAHDLDAHMAF